MREIWLTVPAKLAALLALSTCAAAAPIAQLQDELHGELEAHSISKADGHERAPARLKRLSRQLVGEPITPIQIFRKPKNPTGHLQLVEEGLNVLIDQTEPFAIISALGPTRTGKSTLLGRTFLRDDDVNAFEIGGGISSFTGGVWILSRPITVTVNDTPLNVFLIDTEGFSGLVGGFTSMTYEANLFGICYLMSSAILFNSMFPIDASTLRELDKYASHALSMLSELSGNNVVVNRSPPELIWTVQNFNYHNLANSGWTVEELLENYRATSASPSATTKQKAAMLFGASKAPNEQLLDELFSNVKLVPIRRPTADDEILANIQDHPISDLSEAYLADTDYLKQLVLKDLLASHVCAHGTGPFAYGPNGPQDPPKCIPQVQTGADLVRQMRMWLEFGSLIVDDPDRPEELNVTTVIEHYVANLQRWEAAQCRHVQAEALDNVAKLQPPEGSDGLSMEQLEPILNKTMADIGMFPRAALIRMIKTSEFWKIPADIATTTTTRADEMSRECATAVLAKIRNKMRSRISQGTLNDAAKQATKGTIFKIAKTGGALEVVASNTLSEVKNNVNAKSLGSKLTSFQADFFGANDAGISESHEECFLMFD